MRSIALFCSLLFSVMALGQTDSTLTVVVQGIENASGHMLVALYDAEEDWLDPSVALYTRKAPSVADVQRIDFAHLAPGKYAVAVLHDADDSSEMTYSTIGIPKEQYGFSNDAKGFMSAPDFEDCLFEFERVGTIRINLK